MNLFQFIKSDFARIKNLTSFWVYTTDAKSIKNENIN